MKEKEFVTIKENFLENEKYPLAHWNLRNTNENKIVFSTFIFLFVRTTQGNVCYFYWKQSTWNISAFTEATKNQSVYCYCYFSKRCKQTRIDIDLRWLLFKSTRILWKIFLFFLCLFHSWVFLVSIARGLHFSNVLDFWLTFYLMLLTWLNSVVKFVNTKIFCLYT